MKVNSYWEKTKFNLPFAIGLIIWTIIFSILFFNGRQGEGGSYSEWLTFILVFTLLVVGIPTCVFEIVFVYIVKVVKMKPKSSYDIGNINDYINLQELFRSGNYEYETIRSKEDIFRAYEVGKKIVFTALTSGERLFIWIGIIFTIAGLILSSVLVIVISSLNFPLDVLVYTFLLMFFLMTGLGAIFFIPGFFRSRRLPRSFFILAPEGIVYRRTWSGVMSYSWKELDLEVYSVRTIHSWGGFFKMEFPATTELHIILPNGSRLKFIPYDYNLDEFLSFNKFLEKLREKTLTDRKNINISASVGLNMERATFALVFMAFKHYFDAAKGVDIKKDQIFYYLKTNAGKEFTAQALLNRINEIGLSEKMINDLDLNTIEQILDDLSVNRKITRKDKEGMKFYFF